MPSADQSYQSSTPTATTPSKQANFHHQTSASRSLNYFQPQSTTAAALTLATPHYHQHRLLLTPQSPLLFPSSSPAAGFNSNQQAAYIGHHNHHLHPAAASSVLATAASTAAASGAASNGSFQTLSSLSPDARACFTATYLCVLIVNNTWLDCNLLEMLCNGTTHLKSSGSSDGPSSKNDSSDEEDLHASQRSREQLEAFEMILNDLVAFAGGGRDEGGGSRPPQTSNSNDRSHLLQLHHQQRGINIRPRISPRDGIYIAPIDLKLDGEPELPRQVVPPDDGGGGGSGSSGSPGNASIVTLFYSDNNQPTGEQGQDELKQGRLANEHQQQQQQQQKQNPRIFVAKLNELPDDDDQVALLKQYFDVRRAQLAAQKQSELQRGENQPATEEQSRFEQSGSSMAPDENTASTTTSTARPNPGLIATWISRPIRDWSSYLFWSTSSSGDSVNRSTTLNDNDAKQGDETNRPPQQQQAIQLLRPIDRTEGYNMIPTNQTSQKQQQFLLELPYNLPAIVTTTNNHRGQSSLPNRQQASGNQKTQIQLVASGSTRGNSPFSSEFADQMSIPLTTLSDLVGSSSSVTMAEVARQQSSTSNPMLQQQQQPQQHQFSRQQQVGRPTETSYTNTIPIRAAYETSSSQSMQIFQQKQQQQQQQQNVMFTRQQQQQQQQQQNSQTQYPRLGEDGCDCEFLSGDEKSPVSPSSLFNAYATDSCYRYCQARLASTPQMSSSTPSLLDQQQTSPITSFSTTSSTSLTTSGTPVAGPSGGKMNPMDVTFQLYTRRHRDMINGAAEAEADLLQLQTSGGSTSPSTRNPSSSTSIINGNSGTIDNQYRGSEGPDRKSNPNNSFNIGLGEVLDLNNEETLSDSTFNGSLPVKFIIHGFGSGGRRPWVADMVYKLLDYENVNVIVVDWEKGATLPNYVQAAGNTRLVGHKIASLIRAINARHGLTASSYHLIGFSLGAHVAGFAGMEIRNSTSISHHWINRITGLDPASPLFEGYEADDRLDPSDAQFVDVIHSNGDGVLRGGFGSLQPMGHVDFYPNGGRVQVGCNSVLLSALSDIIYGKWQSLCNHRRALNFFMDSFEIDKCKFRSFNCDSYESYLKGECFDCGLNDEKCSYMGYLANHSKGRGKMYLTTHEEAPFCANQFLIKIVGTKGFKTHWGKVEVTLVGQDGRNESLWLSATSSQQSNNHELPNGHKDLIQHSMQSLIVSHLALANLTHILLRYTKYRGWIYSGGESWSIDKVYITDSDGRVKSFCGYSTILDSHVTTRLSLDTGNCTVNEAASLVSPAGQQISRASGSTTPGTNTLITNGLQQQQQQQNHHQQQQQQQQQQSQTSQPRTPRMYSSIIQPLNEPQAQPILANTFQMGSFPANDWHRQLGFGKFNNPSPPMIAT